MMTPQNTRNPSAPAQPSDSSPAGSSRSTSMFTQRKRLTPVCVLVGGLTGLFGTTALSLTQYAQAGGKAAAGRQKAEPPIAHKDSHEVDRAEIQAQTQRFLQAFQGGDAERVASFWTADGELLGGDGEVYRGRAAIANAYRELFGTKEKRRAEI